MNSQNLLPELIETDDLELDLTNPRFGLSKARGPDEALQFLFERADLKELWDSFAQKGFERYEPLIAIKNKEGQKFTVIEGNRRLAAVKTMLEPSLLASFSKRAVPAIPPEHKESLLKLPVFVVGRREDAYDYIGFKHINGPSSWGSLAKAKFGVLLFESTKERDDLDVVLADLSKRLGDTPSQALRTLVAYKIFEQAIRNEFVADPSASDTSVDFSHLYTMLPNPATREYLGLGREPLSPAQIRDNPIPDDHLPRLRNMMGWLFGFKDREPVIKRQGSDRPKLQKVLGSSVATQTLEETGDFEQAVQQAGFARDAWLSNVVKLQSLSKNVYDGVTDITEPLEEKEKEGVRARLVSTQRNVELTLKVI